jgi:hypothetical protein
VLAKQVLYHLSQALGPLLLVFFFFSSRGLMLSLPMLSLDDDSVSFPQVAGIIGISLYTRTASDFFVVSFEENWK